MKKILPILILFILISPAAVAGQAIPDMARSCDITNDLRNIDPLCNGTPSAPVNIGEGDTDAWGACCVVNAIYKIADWIFLALVAIAIIFALLGAYNLITAGGTPEKVTTGRNYILYAIVGLAVGFLALAIPSLAKFVIGAV